MSCASHCLKYFQTEFSQVKIFQPHGSERRPLAREQAIFHVDSCAEAGKRQTSKAQWSRRSHRKDIDIAAIAGRDKGHEHAMENHKKTKSMIWESTTNTILTTHFLCLLPFFLTVHGFVVTFFCCYYLFVVPVYSLLYQQRCWKQQKVPVLMEISLNVVDFASCMWVAHACSAIGHSHRSQNIVSFCSWCIPESGAETIRQF